MGLFEDMSKFNRRQEAVVTAFSRIGYKVVPRKGCPCINRESKTVYLPVVDPDKYPDVLRTIRGWTDHEMAHELYKSSTDVLRKAIAKGKKFENIFRYIEDGRVERLESRDFQGCKENLTYLEKTTLVDRKKMGLTLYLAGKYGQEGVKLYKMDEWGAILGASIIKKCNQIETCQDAYDVAQVAFKRIQKYIESAVDSEGSEEASEDPEQHPSVGKEGTEKKEKGPEKEQDEILQEDKPESKESEDEKEKSDSGDDTSDGEEPDGDSGDKDNPGESPKEESGEVQKDKDDSESTPDHDSEGETDTPSGETPNRDSGDTDNPEGSPSENSDGVPEGTESPEPTPESTEEERNSKIEDKLDELLGDKDLMEGLLEKITADLSDIPEDPRAYTPYTVNDRVHDLTKDLGYFPSKGWFPILIQEARSKVSVMATKLRLELFATKMLFERYKDRGNLDQRRLHVLGMGTTTDVFMKRTVKPELDTAISLLVDASGSMTGTKIALAAQVAYLLSSTLETINIPNEVLSFTDGSSRKAYPVGYDRYAPLEHFIHKSFSSRLKHCTEAMNRIGCAMRNNTDGESVLWAAARLAIRKEKRRILFVLSDGIPSNGHTEESKLHGHLKEMVQMVSKHGIECIGIGIQTNSVKEFYPHNVVVNNIDDLVTTVYGELVKAIRGAKKGVNR
jgi:cobalamin biosynthesis protein CobT